MMSIMDEEASRGNIHGVFLPWLSEKELEL